MRSSILININITFMHISQFILVSKSTSFTFFMWIFAYIITFFHGRFMYIHTFFHRQIMCSCRFAICLYDIRQTSCERRLHHSRVAPSVPIWAKFAPILGNICPWSIRAATPVLSCFAPPRLYIGIYYWEKNSFDIIRTRTWENPTRFFSRRAIICTVYCWEKCKKCKVTYARGFFASIYYFIWIKCSW